MAIVSLKKLFNQVCFIIKAIADDVVNAGIHTRPVSEEDEDLEHLRMDSE